MTDNGTIFALSSGAGRGGVAVIRLSGPQAGAALTVLSQRAAFAPRRAIRVVLRDPVSGEHLDDGLALWFPAPASYTGEDVVELHVHGGRAVLAGVLGALGRCDGLRPAEPGEFTRRAFVHGKMDLTAAEGIADLIDADTAAQRRQALRQMDGALGRRYEGWRARLLRALAHLEADIDFPDEALPDDLAAARRAELVEIAAEIDTHLADGRRGERLRDGIHIVIVGRPNAGKSSLLNRLAAREAAIVSAEAGTTRDVIEVHLDLDGYPVVLVDTAGLRAATGTVEGEGVRRARDRAARADFRLVVVDAADWPEIDAESRGLIDQDSFVLVNKIDLVSVNEESPVILPPHRGLLAVSAATGAGLDRLLARLSTAVAERFDHMEAAPVTRARHRWALESCRDHLDRALAAPVPELAAEDVRLAMRDLGRITGRVDVEDLLDVIFHDFCIGK